MSIASLALANVGAAVIRSSPPSESQSGSVFGSSAAARPARSAGTPALAAVATATNPARLRAYVVED